MGSYSASASTLQEVQRSTAIFVMSSKVYEYLTVKVDKRDTLHPNSCHFTTEALIHVRLGVSVGRRFLHARAKFKHRNDSYMRACMDSSTLREVWLGLPEKHRPIGKLWLCWRVAVAQVVQQGNTNQKVAGSIPACSSWRASLWCIRQSMDVRAWNNVLWVLQVQKYLLYKNQTTYNR